MTPAIEVCIRGAGVVGRTLALLLAQGGLRVGLVRESAPASGAASDVRAYALNAASRELLERVRGWPDEAHATPVLRMEVAGDDSGYVHFDAQSQGSNALAWIVEVQALQERLAQALKYQGSIEWLDAPRAAALTVVCEGKASTTRDEFGVRFDVTPYLQSAVAARVRSGKAHGNVARQWFCNGEILALLPLGGSVEPPGNSAALIWSVGEQRAAHLMAAGAEQFEAQMETASRHALGSLSLSSERACWPLHLARADRWCGPGWALAGDAAHTVHPLAGQGLNLGLADAKELAEVLQRRESWRGVGDLKLLRRYERARKADVLAMGMTTDGLQRLFAQSGQPWGLLRNWGMTGFNASGPLKRWVARRAMGSD
jgi:2-polyprenyl-6-methoxyphenol hydroxylase-like FAD-dependent oxidoreductase